MSVKPLLDNPFVAITVSAWEVKETLEDWPELKLRRVREDPLRGRDTYVRTDHPLLWLCWAVRRIPVLLQELRLRILCFFYRAALRRGYCFDEGALLSFRGLWRGIREGRKPRLARMAALDRAINTEDLEYVGKLLDELRGQGFSHDQINDALHTLRQRGARQ